MDKIVLKVNPKPEVKSILEVLFDSDNYIPPIPYNDGIFSCISLASIKNINHELYPSITVEDFIKIHEKALRIAPAFKFSEATNSWYFELSVKEFAKLRKWEVKQYFEMRMLNKYPVWKQLNIVNDKDFALIQLTKWCELETTEIMKVIQEVVPINTNSKLPEIKNYEKTIPTLDYKIFVGLKPISFRIADIEKWVRPILHYLVYYYTSVRIRQVVQNEEKKLDVCTTFESIASFMPIDPAL